MPDERVADVTDWTGVPGNPEADARLAAWYDLQHGFGREDPPWPDIDWFRTLASGVGGPVLELGCGSGRVAAALAADGHSVVGLDRSPAMLSRARERVSAAGMAAEFVIGDLGSFALGRRFPLVVVPFNTFLMLAPSDRAACLARIREHLEPNGQLAIDIFQPDPERIAGLDGGVVDEGTHEDPRTGELVSFFTSSRATVDGTTTTLRIDVVGPDSIVRRQERRLTLHFLYRREAALLLEGAGFAVLSIHGDQDGSPADERSPRLLILAQRRERGAAGERRR